jgi:hypothetical protein
MEEAALAEGRGPNPATIIGHQFSISVFWNGKSASTKLNTKPDHFLVSFDRQFADVRPISLIGSTTNLLAVRLNQGSNAASPENASQLPIEPPNDRWPLGFIASQLFILRPLDRSNSLVLRYAACNRLLNGVTDIHQHLSITEKLFAALRRLCGKGTMSRNEDICIETCRCLHGLQPVKAVAIVHE